jgi:hypothetical protein
MRRHSFVVLGGLFALMACTTNPTTNEQEPSAEAGLDLNLSCIGTEVAASVALRADSSRWR